MNFPALRSARPSSISIVLLIVVFAVFAAGLFVIDFAGERVIAEHQRLIAQDARDYYAELARQGGLAAVAEAMDRRAEHDRGDFQYAVYDNDGERLGGAPLLSGRQIPPAGFSVQTIGTGEAENTYEIFVQPLSSGGTIAVFEDLSERSEFQRAILIAAGTALLVGLVIVAAASLWFGQLLLRRASGIATVAKQISGGDLSARAPVVPTGDVFDKLAASVNAMLDRIEELMTGLQTVTDSLAHDLRSPLTRLRGALARALEPNISHEDRLALIECAHNEADSVLSTFGALLDVARAETGLSREMMEAVDLTEMVSSLGELFAPAFEDAKQTLTVTVPEAPLIVTAHELILRQALGNLLHNANRYADQSARIALSLEREKATVRFTVADDGPGIPEHERGRVQQRFVRLDASRGTEGSGLGLAIAAACAKLHGGCLTLEDNHPGLRATIEFPCPPVENT